MMDVSIAYVKVKSKMDEKACNQMNNDMHKRNICIEFIFISSFSVALDMVSFSLCSAPSVPFREVPIDLSIHRHQGTPRCILHISVL